MHPVGEFTDNFKTDNSLNDIFMVYMTRQNYNLYKEIKALEQSYVYLFL